MGRTSTASRVGAVGGAAGGTAGSAGSAGPFAAASPSPASRCDASPSPTSPSAALPSAVLGPGSEHAALVARLHEVLDALTGLGGVAAGSLSDDELRSASVSLARVKSRVDAVMMPLARALYERDVAHSVGATSTGALLAGDFGGDRQAAARFVRTAKDLSNAPITEESLAAGTLLGEQARVIAAALTRLPVGVDTEDRQRLERWLISQAAVLSLTDLARAGTRAAQAFATRGDADAHEEDQLVARERRARAECSFWMADNRDGTWRGGFTLPDAEAEMVRAAVEAISAPRRAHLDRRGSRDRASSLPATDQLEPLLPMDRRHREGRAFAAICALLPADRLPTAGGISAVVTVNVDYDTLTGRLGPGTLPSGARISAGRVRQYACTAGVIPQVLGGGSLPLDLGQTQRLFTATQRRALAQRDRGCVFPGCDRPPAWCEGHHWRDPWRPSRRDRRHGPTDLANGCLLCAYHHRLVHEENIAIRERGGHLEFLIPPQRIAGPGMIRGPGRYDGDLLSPTGAEPDLGSGADDVDLSPTERPGSLLQWQRNARWRP